MAMSWGVMARPRPAGHAVAVIGGGFSGAALAAWLLEEGGVDLDIHLVEPRPRLGQGIAYGDAGAHHILNVAADRMSLWVDRPHDFLYWAQQNGPGLGWSDAEAASPRTFLPRRLFGHYVEARLAQVRAGAAARLAHHRDRAVGIERAGDGFIVSLAGGARLKAQSVVLATGHGGPSLPFSVAGAGGAQSETHAGGAQSETHAGGAQSEHHAGGALIADPWAPNALAGIGPRDDVLLIGTGLTMVDQVHSLAAAGHRGTITAISRHGLLPRIQGDFVTVPAVLDVSDLHLGLAHCLGKVRAAIRQGGHDWRGVVEGLRPLANPAWQAMDGAAQARFQRHARAFWEVHRHRVPPVSADTLLGLMAGGRFHAEAAHIERLEPGRDSVRVVLRPRGRPRLDVRHYARVINCIASATLPAGGLERTLIGAGLARAAPAGEGMVLDEWGQVVDAKGRRVPGLFALGPTRRMLGPENTAVPQIRAQLLTLVPLLLERARQVQSA